jgi:hypothetical protein
MELMLTRQPDTDSSDIYARFDSEVTEEMQSKASRNIINRRSLLRSGLLVGAGAATLGAGLAMGAPSAFADAPPVIETPDTVLAGSPPSQVSISGTTYNVQAAWRFCVNCRAMFWSPSGPHGYCPAPGGGATHVPSSSNYGLPHDGPAIGNAANGGLGVQIGWRYCGKCQGLFWGPSAAVSICPAPDLSLENPPHAITSNTIYDMLFGGWASNVLILQSGWNYCSVCRGLYWGNGAAAGICPVRNITGEFLTHVPSASNITPYQVIKGLRGAPRMRRPAKP